MSISHKGSSLQLSNVVLPADRSTSFLAHYDITENDVLRGVMPIQNITTLRNREGKFGGSIAVEEGTTNLWVGGLTPYNNYGVPASITMLSETYCGYPIYRLAMTVDDAHSANLSHFRTSLSSHGVYGGNLSWAQDTKYVSSIYWRPVNKPDTVFGGTASNTSGWSSGGNEDMGGGWKRFYRYRTGVGVATKSDVVHHSFYCPSLELNETIYIDFCCPQTEQGKTYPTSYVEGSRAYGILNYGDASNFIDKSEHTISMWANGNSGSYGVAEGWSMCLSLSPAFYIGWDSPSIYRVSLVDANGAQRTFGATAHTFSPNRWYMVSYTFNNGEVKLYLDGEKVAEGVTPTTTIEYQRNTGETRNLYIGGYYGSNTYTFNGLIDEVRIDKVARTEEEIRSWYLSGNPFSPKGIYRIAY